MQFTTSALLVLVIAVAAQASVIPLITTTGLSQKTVDINGVRGVALGANPSAQLVVAQPAVLGGQALIVGNPLLGGQTLVTSAGLQLAPAGVQLIAV